MDYSREKVKQIADLYGTGDHTVKDICKMVGINPDTYYTWKATKPDFSEALKKADAKRLEAFKVMARSGLAKLLDVYEYDEVTTESNGSWKKVSKKVMPNVTAIIYALNNTDAENFKHKEHKEVTGKDGAALRPVVDLGLLTMDELKFLEKITLKLESPSGIL